MSSLAYIFLLALVIIVINILIVHEFINLASVYLHYYA